MRKPNLLRAALGAALILGMGLVATGCTGSYWTSLLKTSQIQGAVTTKGKIVWKEVTLGDGATDFQPTKTAPQLSLSLIPGSSPVDLEAIEVIYYSPGGGDTGGLLQLEQLYAALPFMVRLQGEAATPVSLSQIITNQLVDLTHPNRGSDRIQDVDIEAVVKFVGRDQFRSQSTFQISVPISIEIEN